MKIAIIGGGISGLTAAHLLCSEYDITLFETADYLGGHTNTLDVQHDGTMYAVDTGFIVFNERTYPNFIRLLDRLGVPSQPNLRWDRPMKPAITAPSKIPGTKPG